MVAEAPVRHVQVEHRREALSEQRWELQVERGLYLVERGERFAIPVDRRDDPTRYLDRVMWERAPKFGVHRPGVVFGLPPRPRPKGGGVRLQGTLAAVHFHRGWADPFAPEELAAPLDPTFETAPWHPGHVARETVACERHAAMYGRASTACSQCDALSELLSDWRLRGRLLNGDSYPGFVEHLGILSAMKVTDAFVSEEIDELVSTAGTEFADFDFHEVGTSNQAEDNNDTALIATSGIARATGSPTDEDPDYANDGTITADATETWEEWLLANNSTGAAAFDRSLTGGQAVNSSDQVTYQYTGTLAPEA